MRVSHKKIALVIVHVSNVLPRHMRFMKAATNEKVLLQRSGSMELVQARMQNSLVFQLKFEALLVFRRVCRAECVRALVCTMWITRNALERTTRTPTLLVPSRGDRIWAHRTLLHASGHALR